MPDGNIDRQRKIQPGADAGTEHILELPPESERETITEADIKGSYQGGLMVMMDGSSYGPYPETITIRKTIYNKITLRSGKTVFGNMPVDLSYNF